MSMNMNIESSSINSIQDKSRSWSIFNTFFLARKLNNNIFIQTESNLKWTNIFKRTGPQPKLKTGTTAGQTLFIDIFLVNIIETNRKTIEDNVKKESSSMDNKQWNSVVVFGCWLIEKNGHRTRTGTENRNTAKAMILSNCIVIRKRIRGQDLNGPPTNVYQPKKNQGDPAREI